MAKTRGRTRPKTMPANGHRVEDEAEALLENLRYYHGLGDAARKGRDKALKKKGRDAKYDAKTTREIADREGVKYDLIRKARRFAELYSGRDLTALLSLRRPDGLPLSWWSVCVLIQVEDKAKRETLQAQAAKEKWSARQLRDAVIALRGEKKSGGGRRVTVPSSAKEALGRLVAECEGWLRHCRAILGEGEPERGVAQARPLAKLLEEGGDALRGLGAELEEARRQMAAVESLARRTKAGLDAARRQDDRIGVANAGAARSAAGRTALPPGAKGRRRSS